MNNICNPEHYNYGDIECIDCIEASLSSDEFEGFLHGNVFKYIWRYKHKGGIEDLKKAEWYLSKLINLYENHKDK